VLLDGDKQHISEFVDPDTIPTKDDGTLGAKIKEATSVEPMFTIDGGAAGGNSAQRVKAQRKYLAWLKKNVGFIPTLCPEELVLRAAGKVDPTATTSQQHKNRLRALSMEVYGADVSSMQTDQHGESLLAVFRANSAELKALAKILENYLASLQPQR